MVYICNPKNNQIYEVEDIEVEDILQEHPEDKLVDIDTAYLILFGRISKIMEYKFSNYRNIDISQECYLYMLNRYRENGVFAPDKSFKDNERIWISFAKKTCFYLIRKQKKDAGNIDIWSIEENETDSEQKLGCEDNHSFEGSSVCQDIIQDFERLCNSEDKTDRQLGWYGKAKVEGLTDKAAGCLLNIGMPRIYELRRELRQYMRNKYHV